MKEIFTYQCAKQSIRIELPIDFNVIAKFASDCLDYFLIRYQSHGQLFVGLFIRKVVHNCSCYSLVNQFSQL